VTYVDPDYTALRLSDRIAEAISDLGDLAQEDLAFTPEEAAEMIIKHLDTELLFYGSRYTFYCKLKDAIKQRICTA
jgi:hypothetical protein